MKTLRVGGSAALLAALVLAGCAQPVRRDAPRSLPSESPGLEESIRSETEARRPEKTTRKRPTAPRVQPPAGSEELPMTPLEPEREAVPAERPTGSLTGVPVCDQYLASYRRCHTTIGQSTPAAMDEKFERLRASMVRQSGTPEGRAQISGQCKGLAALVQEALAGRKCGDPPR